MSYAAPRPVRRSLRCTPGDRMIWLDGRPHPSELAVHSWEGFSTGRFKGDTLIIEHTTDNALMSFRYRNANVKMLAAEDDFSAGGHSFHAGAFIIPGANRAQLQPSIDALGISVVAVSAAPTVKTHEMEIPRIGYVHSWQRTQDEGWVRAALDAYGVKYTYFADQKLRDGNLRSKYDVIIFPHVGGSSASYLTGIPKIGPDPVPYKKSDLTPNLGALDQSDDIRGGMGIDLDDLLGEGLE